MGVGDGDVHLFTSSSEAFDYRPAKLEGEGRLWGVGTGDGVAGTVWAAHHDCCFFLLWTWFAELSQLVLISGN
jgi:hypothetical protein